MGADSFRILMATDLHLGYLERNIIRREDPFRAFEEILQIAQREQVDFVLLGGDLYHESKPSKWTLYRSMELIRRYSMGKQPVQFRMTSDPQLLHNGRYFTGLNNEDEHYQVGIPIFSINGNHDEPTGTGGLSAMDLLSVTNLVNYYGKADLIDEIYIRPLVLEKGKTRVALFGLGALRNERLYHTFEKGKVHWQFPEEETFNIFSIHQNRASHTPKGHIPPHFLPHALDIVFWGHEHECRIIPEPYGQYFDIIQPGSPVATSLCVAEAKPKFIGLLTVEGKNYQLDPIPLQSVRPMLFQDLSLADLALNPLDHEAIFQCLEDQVSLMIDEVVAESPLVGGEKLLPLIRLRVDRTQYDHISILPQRFGQKFVGRVANPEDLISFTKTRRVQAKVVGGPSVRATQDNASVVDILKEHLHQVDTVILEEQDFCTALMSFVGKQESAAVQDYIRGRLRRICNEAISMDGNVKSDMDGMIGKARLKLDAERRTGVDIPDTLIVAGGVKEESSSYIESEEDIPEEIPMQMARRSKRKASGSTPVRKLHIEESLEEISEESVVPVSRPVAKSQRSWGKRKTL